MAKKVDYKNWEDHDILVSVATKQDTICEDIIELKAEDRRLHHRINDSHKRINGIRFWSAGAGGIGGIMGAFLALFSSK